MVCKITKHALPVAFYIVIVLRIRVALKPYRRKTLRTLDLELWTLNFGLWITDDLEDEGRPLFVEALDPADCFSFQSGSNAPRIHPVFLVVNPCSQGLIWSAFSNPTREPLIGVLSLSTVQFSTSHFYSTTTPLENPLVGRDLSSGLSIVPSPRDEERGSWPRRKGCSSGSTRRGHSRLTMARHIVESLRSGGP